MLAKKYTKEDLLTYIPHSGIEISDYFKNDNTYTDDIEVMTVAVKHSGALLEYASDRLKNNKDFVNIAIERDENSLYYATELTDNKEFMLEVLTNNGYLLQYASERLKDDEQIVTTAVIQFANTLQWASKRLKLDEAILLTAIKQNPRTFAYATQTLQNDSLFMLKAIIQHKNVRKLFEMEKSTNSLIKWLSQNDNLHIDINIEDPHIKNILTTYAEEILNPEPIILSLLENTKNPLEFLFNYIAQKHRRELYVGTEDMQIDFI